MVIQRFEREGYVALKSVTKDLLQCQEILLNKFFCILYFILLSLERIGYVQHDRSVLHFDWFKVFEFFQIFI